VAGLPILFHPAMAPARRLDLVLLPVSSAIFAVMVHLAARTRRSYEESLRRAHLRLTEADELTAAVADTMTVGIGLLRADGTLRFTNAAFDAMAKRAAFDTASLRANRGFATDRVTPVVPEEAVFQRALEGRFGEEHLYWVGEPGDQRGLLVTAHELTRPDADPLGIAMIAYDVTDLVTAVRIRDEFLTTVTHELRTPLTSIVGYLDLIADETDAGVPDIVSAHLRVVSRNVDELLSRVGDLLDASSQDVDLHRRVTRADEVVLRVVESAHVYIDTSELEPVTARIDEPRLSQVMTNLLSNAVKYTPAGGRVSIVVCAEGDDVVLEVRDNGVGIAPEDQVHVFTRFFRADEARLGAVPGTGIGLPIAKKLTEAHGGTLTLVSRLGEGSTFTVRIPRDLPEAAPERTAG
jgi:signal transduction histidine kinase